MNDQKSPDNAQPDLNSLLAGTPPTPGVPAGQPAPTPNSSFNGGSSNSSFSGSYSGVPPAPQPFDLATPPNITPVEVPSNPQPSSNLPEVPMFSSPPPPSAAPVQNTPASNPHTPWDIAGQPSQPAPSPVSTQPAGLDLSALSTPTPQAPGLPDSNILTPPTTPGAATPTSTPAAGGGSGFNWAPPAAASHLQTDSATTMPTTSDPTNNLSGSTSSLSNFAPADLSNINHTPPTPAAPSVPTVLPSTPPTAAAAPTTSEAAPLGTVAPVMDTENTPTDLSHLVQANEQPPAQPTQPSYNPTTAQATDSLVVPSQANTDSIPTTSVSTAKDGIPKWVIILGVVLLLAVASASAYFILGIGRNSAPPASAPATSQEQQQIVPPPTPAPTTAPTPVATSSAQPVATGSAGFNNLNQKPATASGTSALDQLRQRQGQ